MAAPPTQTTELSAINSMLQSIGERPIANITDTQRLDVHRATSALNETNVVVQTRGWWFNNESQVLIAPNGDAEYEIDDDVVKVDPYDGAIWHYVQRGRRMWNTITHVFDGHTENLYVNQVRLLAFDDCPETFKAYVARRAGVLFQTRTVGSPTLFEFTEKDTNEAYLMLQQEEMDNEDINMTYSPGTRDAVYDR
jgi:hypothetical protein